MTAARRAALAEATARLMAALLALAARLAGAGAASKSGGSDVRP